MAESGEGKKNSTKYEGGNSQTQDDGTSGHVPDRSHMSDDYTEKKTNQMPKQNTSSNTTAGKRINSQNRSRFFVSQAKDKFDKNEESQESREERLHGKNTSRKVATKADLSSGQTRPEKFDNKKGEDGIKVTASNSAKGNGLTGFEHQTSAETSYDHSNLVIKDQDLFVFISKEISINVKWLCGKTVKLQIDPSDSIYSVKIKLGNPEGICLMFQDKELVEEKPLLYYEIKDGDTLYALNRQESDKSSTADDLKNTQNQPMTTGETTRGNDRKGMENPEITTGDSTVGSGSKDMENPAMTAGDSTGGNGSKVTQYPAMTAGESSGGNDTKGLQNQPMCTGDTTGGNDRTGMQNPAMPTGDSTRGNGLKGTKYQPMTTVDSTGGNGSKGRENQPAGTGDSAEGSDLSQRQEPGMAASNADEGHKLTEIHKQTMTACDSPAGLQVFVVALDKKKIAIDVKPDETVAAVKEKLMDKIACETEDFCFNLDGERLNDKHTVKSYKIQPNSEIITMRQRRKGGNKEKMPSLSSTDEHGTGTDQELLQKDDTVQLYSSSDSSESIVETISCEDLDEQIREWENSSTSSMTIITHIADDKEKNIKLETVSEGIGVCPLQGTDCVSGRKVDNAAKIPQTQIARGKEENKVPETLDFSIEKVGNRFILKCNNLVVKVPQLEGASGVSVYKDFILIDNEPVYNIKIDNGKVKISKIGDAECEVNRIDNNSTNNSGNNESGLYVESQQPQNIEEELDIKKVRGTTQDMQNVLNQPQENGTNPWNHHDTVADVKHTGSFDAYVLKERGKTAFDITREQQQSLEEAVSKDEKPPKPAARSKMKNAEKLENMSKSELTFKGYDGKKEGMTGKHVAISKRIVGASYQ